jgi:hypothetical protein
VRKLVSDAWSFVFDHEISPLRHIPDIGTRHMILQVLGWMWAISFCAAIGSYTYLGASLVGHAFPIAATAITVSTWTTATVSPKVFASGMGRRKDGEHI